MEEALANEEWKILKKLHQHNNYLLSTWYEGQIECWEESEAPLKFPHRAYSLLSTCIWFHTTIGDAFCNWKMYMDVAAGLGHYDLVKYMHTHRKEGYTINAMNWAAGNGYLKIVQFLHENRKEGCSHFALTLAATNGHIDVVKFLFIYGYE